MKIDDLQSSQRLATVESKILNSGGHHVKYDHCGGHGLKGSMCCSMCCLCTMAPEHRCVFEVPTAALFKQPYMRTAVLLSVGCTDQTDGSDLYEVVSDGLYSN